MKKKIDKFFFDLYWARPETALLHTLEYNNIKKFFLKNKKILDIGCGNGIYMSALRGFKFDKNFDAFQNINLNKKDIFNSFHKKRKSKIFTNKTKKIDYGIDINENMINICRSLNTYKNVLKVDARKIPIKNNSIDIIFSNSLRDFDNKNFNKSIVECKRILNLNGLLILTVPTENYKKMLYFINQKNKNKISIFKKLDRGRSFFCKQIRTLKQWNNYFTKHNLKIIKSYDFMGPSMMNFWDIGLRVMAPKILEISMNIYLKNLLKKNLVNFFYRLLLPYIIKDKNNNKHGFRTLVCKKIK